MESITVLNTESCSLAVKKAEGDKPAKVSSLGSAARKSLADISNQQQQAGYLNQDGKPGLSVSLSTKEYIEKLQREYMAMRKHIADRDKIIELRGMDLQKLRINLQKVQLQNFQLAQVNSQLLAELNSGKDRLKILQHELACKDGLLKARKLKLEGKAKTKTYPVSENKVQRIDYDEGDDKSCNSSRRQQLKNKSCNPSSVKVVQDSEKDDSKRPPARRQSARFKTQEQGSADIVLQIDDAKQRAQKRLSLRRQSDRFKPQEARPAEALFELDDANEEAENKRLCIGRQSARPKCHEEEAHEDLFEIDDSKFPVSPLCDQTANTSSPPPSDLFVKKNHEGKISSPADAQEIRRSSIGRPLRRAAEKVHSYKERPINIKMRREKGSEGWHTVEPLPSKMVFVYVDW
ncbi:SHUGOSHIN 2 isoform X2 [Carica papaya]|uniref:SHUGOSHIN 2 isoform X2 n=1 Tax=Carica papaya TaxID=3649 RepID=UPI000B8CC108|nr:SHUGOSHIN 2 isoform X2 [Carica papaya]